MPGDCAQTPVTFSVTSTGVLAITAPTTLVDLGAVREASVSGAAGDIIGSDGNFGLVTVTDNRALDPAAWTATVSSTDFLNVSTGTSADTIPAQDATYLIPPVDSANPNAIAATAGLPLPGTGAVGATTDLAIPDTGTLASPQTQPLGGVSIPLTGQTPAPVVTVTGADGDNGAQWNPEIAVTIPAHAVVGVYDGWVTHSVS